MNDDVYVYPDINDTITSAFIGADVSWDREEKEILEYAKSFVRKSDVFVDAGCGFGRLIPVFAPLVKRIIAIEPDAQRINNAKQTVIAAGLATKVEFIQSPIESVTLQNSADVVLSSHIIQHISTKAVPIVLARMRSMLKMGGVLILMTNHAPARRDHYVQSFLRDGKSVQERINKLQFERSIGGPSGIVPVHQYGLDTLIGLMRSVRMRVVAHRTFHPNRTHPNGRDLLLIAQK